MARGSVYNKNVTEEEYAEVLHENKELLDEFVDYLHSTNRANLTVNGYISDIKIFFVWNKQFNMNVDFINLSKRNLVKYQSYLINTLGLNASRVRRLKSALSSMSNFIENILDEEYPTFRNIINRIEHPPIVPTREKSVFKLDEIEKLLKHLIDNKKYQSACALALAYSSGARKGELARFKTQYFDEVNLKYGSLYKTPEIKTKGRGKGGKMLNRWVLKPKFKKYFDLWIVERNRLGITSDYLLVSSDKSGYIPITKGKLEYMSKEFSDFLGKDFYWHSMRHWYVTMLSENNIPDTVIKEIMGWSSVEMVAIYVDTEIDDTLESYFNEDGIKEVTKTELKDLK